MFDPNRRIVLVGNGPSLKDRGMGDTIEAAAEKGALIVRMNNCPTRGYEHAVGHTTHHWVLGWDRLPPRNAITRETPVGTQLIWSTMGFHMKDLRLLNVRTKKYSPVPVFPMPHGVLLAAYKMCGWDYGRRGVPTNGQGPSTGCLTAVLYSQILRCPRVFYAGLNETDSNGIHYYGGAKVNCHPRSLEDRIYAYLKKYKGLRQLAKLGDQT